MAKRRQLKSPELANSKPATKNGAESAQGSLILRSGK